jgi:hypothetical protein
MAAGGLWFSLVVPDDKVINEAISAWNAVASAARELFDADVPQVRDAVRKAWESTEALPPADRAIEDLQLIRSVPRRLPECGRAPVVSRRRTPSRGVACTLPRSGTDRSPP